MTLTEAEMIQILEAIARDGTNGAARIAAIKQLRDMRSDTPPNPGFAALDELAPRRAKG